MQFLNTTQSTKSILFVQITVPPGALAGTPLRGSWRGINFSTVCPEGVGPGQRFVLKLPNSQANEYEQVNPANTKTVSLIHLVIKSLTLHLQTLLCLVQTCKGCSNILGPMELPWQVAVEQEFWVFPNLDISSWLQTLRFNERTESSDVIVSALHPLPRPDENAIQIRDVNQMLFRYAGVTVGTEKYRSTDS